MRVRILPPAFLQDSSNNIVVLMLGQCFSDNVCNKIEDICYSFLWKKIWKGVCGDKIEYYAEWEMRQEIWSDFYNIISFEDIYPDQILQADDFSPENISKILK